MLNIEVHFLCDSWRRLGLAANARGGMSSSVCVLTGLSGAVYGACRSMQSYYRYAQSNGRQLVSKSADVSMASLCGLQSGCAGNRRQRADDMMAASSLVIFHKQIAGSQAAWTAAAAPVCAARSKQWGATCLACSTAAALIAASTDLRPSW